MIAVSASKLATADLNNLMQALELDVVALTEMLIPSGYRAEMGTIDAPAIHYTISGRGRISIGNRSEEHTSELQSLMRISYAVFCLKKKTKNNMTNHTNKMYKYYKTK